MRYIHLDDSVIVLSNPDSPVAVLSTSFQWQAGSWGGGVRHQWLFSTGEGNPLAMGERRLLDVVHPSKDVMRYTALRLRTPPDQLDQIAASK